MERIAKVKRGQRFQRFSTCGFLANDPKEEAVVKFYEKIPKELIPILAETKVYDEELGYAGTFDILFYYDCPTDETKSGFFICDWKTNKDLFKNFNNQKLLEPFSGLLDSPISLYYNCRYMKIV